MAKSWISSSVFYRMHIEGYLPKGRGSLLISSKDTVFSSAALDVYPANQKMIMLLEPPGIFEQAFSQQGPLAVLSVGAVFFSFLSSLYFLFFFVCVRACERACARARLLLLRLISDTWLQDRKN